MRKETTNGRVEFGYDLQTRRDGAILDEDTYLFKVVACRKHEKDGKHNLIVDLEVQEGECKGQIHTEFFPIDTDFGSQRFANLYFSCHPKDDDEVLGFDIDEDLVGFIVYGEIENKDYEGKPQARVKNDSGFSPAGKKATAKRKAKKAPAKRKPKDDEGEDDEPEDSGTDTEEEEEEEKPKRKRRTRKKPAKKPKEEEEEDDGEEYE